MKKSKLISLLIAMQAIVCGLSAQTSMVKGYVFNEKDGSPVYLASVQISNTNLAALTNESGYFIFNQVPRGEFVLKINCMGYNEYEVPVTLSGPDQQLVIKLVPSVISLKEVQVSGQRQNFSKTMSIGAVQISQGLIKKVPTIGGQSDLAQFLQVIPGITFTGDRGGQFYIRGGAPIYNKVMVDGLTVINPFHSIGFMSVIDTDIIGLANVYTAGFNAQYSGRLSSVIDLRTRDGNRRQLEGKATMSTYGYDLLIHGPIIKMTDEDARSVSFLINNKFSYIDKIAPTIYPWLDSLGLPYGYNDFYGKISFVGRKGDQLSLFGHHFTDKATFSSTLKTNWESNSIGTRLLIAPSGSKHLLVAFFGISDFQATIVERDLLPRSTRYNNFQANIGSSAFLKETEVRWSLEISGIGTRHTFLDFNDMFVTQQSFTTDLNLSGQMKRTLGNLVLEPGLNAHYYSAQGHLALEPRLQVKYNVSPTFNLNMAGGLYSQDLISTISEQDITVLFQGFYAGGDLVQKYFRGKEVPNIIQKAWHAVTGVNWLPLPNLKITTEVYVKDFYKLINSNRHKIFEDTKANLEVLDYLKKQFIIEKGWSYGLDFLVDYQSDKIGCWVGYSLGFATREDEYTSFTPHFDRRHNLNLMFNYQPGKNLNLKARWNLASGFPFTQNLGLYEELLLDYGTLIQSGSGRGDFTVFYGPYNEGRLPWYHRLDLSVSWTIELGRKVSLEINGGVLNVYNRQNPFYLDRLTGKQVNQLPLMPHAGVTVRFK